MRDIPMYCSNPECVCEDICCQACEYLLGCEKRCDNVKYKERLYSDDRYLIKQLELIAVEKDLWLPLVAAERIRVLAGIEDEVEEVQYDQKL